MTPRGLLAVLAAVTCLSTGSAPALAHETDPRIVAVVDGTTPPLPPGVVVQIRASIAEEVVAANPTVTPLVIHGEKDRPFLRISRAGVLADLNSVDWYRTNSPVGSGPLPQSAVPGAPARWVLVSRADSWGWFDHRLHPQRLVVPADVTATTRVGDWRIPVEYGGVRSLVSGHLELVPILGAFTVTADPAPGGLTVVVLGGRLPGLFLTDPQGAVVVVSGSDGKPFIRLTRGRTEVDLGSPSWVEDQRARGNDVPRVVGRPTWHTVATTPSVTWLEPRLRYAADLPPDPAKAADLERWTIPLTVDGKPTALSGLIRWTPTSAAGKRARTRGTSDTASVFVVIGIVLLFVAAGSAVSVVKARRVPLAGTRA